MSPNYGSSGDPSQAPFAVAHKTDLPMWAWFELPDNAYRLKRFSVAMEGVQNMGSPGAILEGKVSCSGVNSAMLGRFDLRISGYDWKSLPSGSVVVDVGGGIGSQSLALAKAYDHLKFVVQDRDSVVADAVKVRF